MSYIDRIKELEVNGRAIVVVDAIATQNTPS